MKAMSRILTKCCMDRKHMRIGMLATPMWKSALRLHSHRSKGNCMKIFNGSWNTSAARSSKWQTSDSRV